MSNWERLTKKKSFGEKLYEFLERKPENYDVAFCVGSGEDKKIVKALRVILKAASPVFEKEFEGNWEVYEISGNNGEGIPLPDFSAEAFQLFVKLTILDNWTLESLKKLNLSPEQLLSLLTICRRFEMRSAVIHLEILATSFIQSFSKYKETEDFLKLSQTNLETVLASDDLQMDELEVFECACRWAEAKCKEREIEASVENLREVLGGCLFQIRFPIMPNDDFEKAIDLKSILTTEEEAEIMQLEDETGLNYNSARLSFSNKKRSLRRSQSNFPGCSTLCLTDKFQIVDNPSFRCDGSMLSHCLASKHKISLIGLGFLGPIDADSVYDVYVRLIGRGTNKHPGNTLRQRIHAQKGQTFYFIFDRPVTILPGTLKDWTNYCYILYYLKGPRTPSIQRVCGVNSWLQDGDMPFRVGWESKQLSEILYKKL